MFSSRTRKPDRTQDFRNRHNRYPGMTGSFTVEVDDDERIFKVTESESLSPPRGDSGLV
ncbi:hypothetical protein PABG_11380 [Paracoccidioides brasiliensis Pb03]|nr:hypothetical protein PABG_11380 [Paracoccidioides brasiliensis Pb03]